MIFRYNFVVLRPIYLFGIFVYASNVSYFSPNIRLQSHTLILVYSKVEHLILWLWLNDLDLDSIKGQKVIIQDFN